MSGAWVSKEDSVKVFQVQHVSVGIESRIYLCQRRYVLEIAAPGLIFCWQPIQSYDKFKLWLKRDIHFACDNLAGDFAAPSINQNNLSQDAEAACFNCTQHVLNSQKAIVAFTT